MELNKIHHLDNREGLAQLPDKCCQLLISDPPYFEVKGEFDFVWKSFDEYLQFMEHQAQLYKRILADNGTLFVWGHAKRIAYIQTIFDKYFDLISCPVWEKTECQTMRSEVEALRTFAPVTERLLMYSTEQDATGLEILMETHIKPLHPFANYLRKEFERAGVTNKEVSKLFPSRTGGLTGCVSNWLNGDNVPTLEQYEKIKGFLGAGFLDAQYADLVSQYENIRLQHEDLRKEYEEQRRPFNAPVFMTDVLKYSQESHITKNFDHETKKPEKLTRALILTCSRPDDLVVVPFAGSGTECAMAAKEGAGSSALTPRPSM